MQHSVTSDLSRYNKSTTVFVIWASIMNDSFIPTPNSEWDENREDHSLQFWESANLTPNQSENFSVAAGNGTFTLGPIIWRGSKIVSFIASTLIMTETVFGNLLVVLSVALEKKLQTPFNYYIVNLALTDLNIGLSVMTLFIIYNLYEYFPFDFNTCRYGMV